MAKPHEREVNLKKLLLWSKYIWIGLSGILLALGIGALFAPNPFARVLSAGTVLCALGGLALLAVAVRRIGNYLLPVITSHKDMQTLLDTLDEAIMVFDRGGVIQMGCSQSAQHMFGIKPEGKTIYEILQLTGRAQESVKRWLELTFSEIMAFEDMIPLAPKSYERLKNRYYELKYRPIYGENKALEKIMLIAADKTEEKRLLEQSENEHAMANVVMTILKDRKGFHQFVKDVREGMLELVSALDETPSSLDVEMVLRNFHTIKSIAAQYHVIQLSRASLQYETELTNIQAEGGHRLTEFLPVLQRGVVQMANEFEGFLKENEDLIGPIEYKDTRVKSVPVKSIYKVSQFLSDQMGSDSEAYQQFLKEFVLEDIANGIEKYRELIYKLSDRQGKVIDFQLVFSGIQVCMDSYQSLVSALVHVFRNAVDHGIEPIAERTGKNKLARGMVQVSFERVPIKQGTPRFRIVIADDGRGVNPDLIRERLLARGLLTEEKARELSDEIMLQYIFHHGMTTKEAVTNISGRGIGLDTVKYEAAKLGGTAWVESKINEGCTFYIEIPIYESPVFRPVDLNRIRPQGMEETAKQKKDKPKAKKKAA